MYTVHTTILPMQLLDTDIPEAEVIKLCLYGIQIYLPEVGIILHFFIRQAASRLAAYFVTGSPHCHIMLKTNKALALKEDCYGKEKSQREMDSFLYTFFDTYPVCCDMGQPLVKKGTVYKRS